jgi:hypothetical protein
MSRKWTLPILMLLLGSSGTLQANPLDSPGIVYIDGLPCNSACQSYMAASARALSARHRAERGTNVAVPAEAEIERVEQAPRPRAARHPAPVSRTSPRAGIAALNAKILNAKILNAKILNAKTLNTKAANTKRAATPGLAAQTTPKEIPAATPTMTPEKAVEKAVAGGEVLERKLQSSDKVEPGQQASIAATPPAEAPKSETKPEPEIKSEAAATPPAEAEITVPPATLEIAALPAAAASTPRTLQEQVVEATGMADRVTAITVARPPAGPSDNPEIEPAGANDAGKTASGSTGSSDNLVALVLARPEINSLSDLNNKNIAIEEKQSAASGSVSAALMAAGAAEVQFSEAKTGAIEQLIKGEVPAAVLTLASREAAEWFPDIEGFRTFRVPLSMKARL